MPTKSGLRECLTVDKPLIAKESPDSAAEKVASSARGCEPRPNRANAARQTLKASKESESKPVPDSYNALSKRELVTLLRLKEHRFDSVDLATLREFTLSELRSWRRRARQRILVNEASEYARWVMSSGLVKLLRGSGTDAIEELRKEILWECEQAWRNQEAGGWVGGQDIGVLTAKVDRLTAVVSDLVRLQGGQLEPGLKVLDGSGGCPTARSAEGGH